MHTFFLNMIFLRTINVGSCVSYSWLPLSFSSLTLPFFSVTHSNSNFETFEIIYFKSVSCIQQHNHLGQVFWLVVTFSCSFSCCIIFILKLCYWWYIKDDQNYIFLDSVDISKPYLATDWALELRQFVLRFYLCNSEKPKCCPNSSDPVVLPSQTLSPLVCGQ